MESAHAGNKSACAQPNHVHDVRACTAGLFPAPIVGPLLGILGVYIADRGDLGDVRRKLFGKGSRGQFKSG